jgi:hypothetical protein
VVCVIVPSKNDFMVTCYVKRLNQQNKEAGTRFEPSSRALLGNGSTNAATRWFDSYFKQLKHKVNVYLKSKQNRMFETMCRELRTELEHNVRIKNLVFETRNT